MPLIPSMPVHAKGAAMTVETDFLTRDTPGPGPHGRPVSAVAPMMTATVRAKNLQIFNMLRGFTSATYHRLSKPRVILNETTGPCILVVDWSGAATQTQACLLMSTES